MMSKIHHLYSHRAVLRQKKNPVSQATGTDAYKQCISSTISMECVTLLITNTQNNCSHVCFVLPGESAEDYTGSAKLLSAFLNTVSSTLIFCSLTFWFFFFSTFAPSFQAKGARVFAGARSAGTFGGPAGQSVSCPFPSASLQTSN